MNKKVSLWSTCCVILTLFFCVQAYGDQLPMQLAEADADAYQQEEVYVGEEEPMEVLDPEQMEEPMPSEYEEQQPDYERGAY